MQTVVLGLLGVTLDSTRRGHDRWSHWRPTVDLCRHEDFLVDRLELLFQPEFQRLADEVSRDIRTVSPETRVVHHHIRFVDPWDFEEVFGALHDFARNYTFDPDRERYLVHISTGTHVAQICQFLLTESRHFPARLLQTAPGKTKRDIGSKTFIDLDLSRYDRLASRFRQEKRDSHEFLKGGIPTQSAHFNQLIERIERVAIGSKAPLLLTGPTGAGKSQLARRIFELKKLRGQVSGRLVEVNCATIRGDAAMSTLFGHRKGAFTGAVTARDGLLREANAGVLFLDEIGELGLEEQAMLLRAVEEGRFLPMGSDSEVASTFQLISGTNKDLALAVRQGSFRQDLLARINLWPFRLPALRERPEDLEPNLDYELGRFGETHGQRVSFNREARQLFLDFSRSTEATWDGNFRDFSAAIERMATLCEGGRIDADLVREETDRLRAAWSPAANAHPDDEGILLRYLSENAVRELDLFDRVQLAEVLRVCEAARSLSDAGRVLYSESRKRKTSNNDADRLRKYLGRFALDWAAFD